MTRFEQVSSDITHKDQSWKYASVWTFIADAFASHRSGTVRVEIRANAYEFQSHATISLWSDEQGWNFHTSIPTEDWYEEAPSYVKKQGSWSTEERELFQSVEFQLISRLSTALLGTDSPDLQALDGRLHHLVGTS